MATHTKETLHAIIEKIRYDTTAIQANITELARAIAALPLPDPKPGQHKCPHDHLAFPSEKRLAEHLANVHHGPPPRIIDVITPTPFGEWNKEIREHLDLARNSEVAFGHARAAEGSDSSDVSKLTCRDESVGDD